MEEVTRPVPVGWLQFFFEDYLPDSPCPPGCRHRHSKFRDRNKQCGSVSSGSPHSSDVGETEEFFASDSSPFTSEGNNYDKFSPIPILLDPPPRKTSALSTPYSDGEVRSYSRSPVGYPEDGYHEPLTASDEELREIDDLISHYSERLSESESDRRSDCSPQKNYKKSSFRVESPIIDRKLPVKQQFSFSDSEIEHLTRNYPQQAVLHRPSQVADCVLSNCHCMNKGRRLSIDDVLFKSPLQHARKTLKDAETQVVFSDIMPVNQIPSPRVTRKSSPLDDDTLTKSSQRQKRKRTNSNQYYSDDSDPDYDTYNNDYGDRGSSSSPEDTFDHYLRSDSPVSLLYEGPDKLYKTNLHKELSGTSSGGLTTSSAGTTSSLGTTASSNITTASSNITSSNLTTSSNITNVSSVTSSTSITTPSSATTASSSITTPSNFITTSSELTTPSPFNKTNSFTTTSRPSTTNTINTSSYDSVNTISSSQPISAKPHELLDHKSSLEVQQQLTCFPPFVIDFFQFAAHPEDYLTDEQLDWYYEGEAKLMKRREERKRARNALIEETTRLEAAASHDPELLASNAADKRSISSTSRELAYKPKNIQDVRSILPDVELVDIPTDLLENPTVIRLAQQLKNSENLRKEVLVTSAKLENERSTLLYNVEDLKDQLEDQTELAAELKISLKSKCRDLEKIRMELSQKSKEVGQLTQQVQQREDLLKEKAGIIITQLGDIMEVPLDSINGDMNGGVDKYSIKKIEDIEKQNNQFKEEIVALRDELMAKSRNHIQNHVENNNVDQDLVHLKRELEKTIEVYKAKLTVEERDKIKLQGQISVLESQVKRYKAQAQSSSEAEDEALREKRRIQREFRLKSEELKNCQDDNSILTKKFEKLQRPTDNR